MLARPSLEDKTMLKACLPDQFIFCGSSWDGGQRLADAASTSQYLYALLRIIDILPLR